MFHIQCVMFACSSTFFSYDILYLCSDLCDSGFPNPFNRGAAAPPWDSNNSRLACHLHNLGC